MESKHKRYQEIGLTNVSKDHIMSNLCLTLILRSLEGSINMGRIPTSQC